MIDQRSRRVGRLLEDFQPVVPLQAGDFFTPWMWAPQPPYRTQAWHEANLIWPVSLTSPSFDEAMQMACRTLGPGEGSAMVVLDEGFHVVFGYVSFASTLVEFGAPVWYGCRAGYEWLERSGHIPLMDLAVWESTAKDRAR